MRSSGGGGRWWILCSLKTSLDRSLAVDALFNPRHVLTRAGRTSACFGITAKRFDDDDEEEGAIAGDIARKRDLGKAD